MHFEEDCSLRVISDAIQAVSHDIRPLIDLSKLGSDDLLLLGLAFLIFTDKDRDGEIPVDALLILATLFLSGL